jgi:hypothetical protein
MYLLSRLREIVLGKQNCAKNYKVSSPAESQVSGVHRRKVEIGFLKRHAVIPNF